MDKKQKCLCRVIRGPLRSYRLFGLMPITYNHPKNRTFEGEFGQCNFQVSKAWSVYSVILLISYNGFFLIDFKIKATNIYDSLSFLNSTLYFGFSTLLAILGLYNTRSMVYSLNGLACFQKMGLLCQDSKQKLLRYSRFGMFLIFIQFLLLVLHDFYVGVYKVHHDKAYDNTFYNLVHNLPTIFQFMFCIICCIYWRLFMCYDSVMVNALEKSSIYNVNEQLDHSPSSSSDFCCPGTHPDVVNGKNLEEELDILRRLHESIRVALMNANDAFNPQLTCFMIIELGVIVMHLYSIILFFQLDVEDVENQGIFFMDIVFVIAHTVGIIFFLYFAHQIRITQNGPFQQLLRVSNRKLTPREFLQVRLFQIKLDATPAQFTSGRMSIIDISLLAPIAGSVVTYLLVALQIKMRTTPASTSIPTSHLSTTAEPE